MPNSETIDMEGVGPVLFERSRRARRIIISVRPGKGTRVAVPRHTSFKSALEFALVKKTWIIKYLSKVKEYEKQKKTFNHIFHSIDRKLARKILLRRLQRLAEKYGFTYNRVCIRNQRTRWGSCSAVGDISLNIKLVALPGELLDYVLLHELVHTRVHNHSQQFWKELGKYVPDPKAKISVLKDYGLRFL
jgi:predicted metal-dependent hydrolase